MAGLHFGSMRNWYFNFGIYEGFLSNIGGPADMAESAKNAFSTEDSGLAAGIGLKFHLYDKIKLFIEYDGQLGLENILKNNLGDNPSNISESINVGLNFAFK
jgi:opacity protein-like surface antigen